MPNPSSSFSPSPLLPPSATAAARRRRRRRRLLPSPNPSFTAPNSASSSSSSSSSSFASSTLSLPSSSPAPSPFHHRFFSPLRASAVPFSWEHHPGIPKTPARHQPRTKPAGAAKSKPLPLPPSHLSSKVVAADPFATAGADYFFIPENNANATRRRRRQQQQRRRRWPAVAADLADWLAVLSLYRSCTRSRDCLAAAGPPPRPRPRSPA